MSQQVGDQEGLVETLERIAPSGRRYERKFARRGAAGLVAGTRAADRAIPESLAPPQIRRRDAVYRRSLGVADALSAAASLLVAVTVVGEAQLNAAAALAVPGIILISKTIGLYDRDQHLLRKTTLEELPALFQVTTVFTLAAWFGERAWAEGGALTKTQIGVLFLTLFATLCLGRELVRQLVKRLVAPERCLLLGDVESAARIDSKFKLSYSMRAELVGRVPLEREALIADPEGPKVLGPLELLAVVIETHDIERVMIASDLARSEEILDAIRHIKAMGVKVSVIPRLLDVVGSSVEFDDVDGITVLGLRDFGLSQSSKILKRAMDVTGAAAILFLLAPLMLLIAAAIKLTSHGPVFFRQKRVGQGGEPFGMLKFRTMVDGADAQKAALHTHNEAADGLFKIAEDPRLTNAGRVLRRASLDELPQLINVLKGEMSLVGPRPLVIDEDRNIKGWERQRLNVSPGMTGFWQILGSSRVPRAEMVKIDYLYGANWSVWLDLKILLRTIPHVLARRGL